LNRRLEVAVDTIHTKTLRKSCRIATQLQATISRVREITLGLKWAAYPLQEIKPLFVEQAGRIWYIQ